MFFIKALTIAGSDCSGGAGIQADIKTFSALGVYGASVITSVTVQNTCSIRSIFNIDPKIIRGQITAVMDDICPETIKIGMVNDEPSIVAIAETIKRYKFKYLIIDPVMVSSSGTRLMKEESLHIFKTQLLPLATLLTPNIDEAEILSDTKISTETDIVEAACIISKMGCDNILIKGGHRKDKVDYLFSFDKSGHYIEKKFSAPTVITNNTHGTGCTLSSAIAAYLGRGLELSEAVKSAKEYLTSALEGAKDIIIGNGHGPLNHFFAPEALIKTNEK